MTSLELAKYQVAFLNRQFIMIMCANGVPKKLIIDIFCDAVTNIKGLVRRVKSGKATKDDFGLMSTCSDVSKPLRLWLIDAVPAFHTRQGGISPGSNDPRYS